MIESLSSIPIGTVKIIGAIFFLIVMFWAVTRPKAYIFSGAPDQKPWRDLRIWAVIVLLVQIYLYMKF